MLLVSCRYFAVRPSEGAAAYARRRLLPPPASATYAFATPSSLSLFRQLTPLFLPYATARPRRLLMPTFFRHRHYAIRHRRSLHS